MENSYKIRYNPEEDKYEIRFVGIYGKKYRYVINHLLNKPTFQDVIEDVRVLENIRLSKVNSDDKLLTRGRLFEE